MHRLNRLLLALVLAISMLSGCREQDKLVIGFLLASDQSPRWATWDEPAFQAAVEYRCPDCDYLTANAGGDEATQAKQFKTMVDKGVDVLVLNAVSGEAGEGLVAKAAKAKIPVVAYDRFVPGADYYVSYDAGAVGRQLAGAVVERVPKRGRLLVVNGAQTDANGVAIKRAVHEILDGTRLTVVAELDPKTWAADETAAWLSGRFGKVRPASIDAIVVANDTQAEGAASALRAAKVPPRAWPVITGQDADLAALRRIIAGEQTLTVFKSFPREAEKAAGLAVDLVTGTKIKGGAEIEGVPSFVFNPIVVTLANLTDTVVRDGIYTTEQLCDPATLEACTRLGIR